MNRTLTPKIVLVFGMVVLLFSTIAAQSSMSPKVKDLLHRSEFLELIEKYGQDELSLSIKGREEKIIEKLSYHLARGFRCQVFASSNKDAGREVAAKLRELQLDSVYVIQGSDKLYKVQMGNFKMRNDAQILLDQLYYAGFDGVWVLETEIHIPKEKPLIDQSKSFEEQNKFYFSVQILATKNIENAKKARSLLESEISTPMQIVESDGFWKLLIGRFENKSDAQALLEDLREKEYFDAWITQIMQ
jgi:hypothetical protein